MACRHITLPGIRLATFPFSLRSPALSHDAGDWSAVLNSIRVRCCIAKQLSVLRAGFDNVEFQPTPDSLHCEWKYRAQFPCYNVLILQRSFNESSLVRTSNLFDENIILRTYLSHVCSGRPGGREDMRGVDGQLTGLYVILPPVSILRHRSHW